MRRPTTSSPLSPARLALLLALVPGICTTVESAPAATRGEPKGAVIVRPECFGHVVEEVSATQGAPGRSYGGVGASRPSKSAPATVSAPPPPSAPSASYDDLAGAAYPEAEEAKPASAPAKPVADKKAKEIADGRFGRDEEQDPRQLERPHEPGPMLDWGATVYLSNDDSMSLASAQRVLWSVMNGAGISPDQIRPHELLNYFSFDTVEPTDDQLFDVLASAEQDGDTLSVALAVKGATPPAEPLDLTLLVDRSCSMEEEGRMDYTRKGLHLLEDQLHAGDRVDVVLFDDQVCTPLENFVVGRDDPALLRRTIDQMQPRGATDLDLGLREAYAVARRHEDTHARNRRMMVVTDALLNTGDINPNTVSEVAKAYEQENIRVTGVGVGRDFNDEVLDLLTEKGKGAYVYLGSEAVVERVFGAGFQSLVQTIAHDVQFALDLPDSLAMARFYGEESSTNAADVQPIHYFAGTSQVFLQDLTVQGGRVRPADPVKLTVTYRDARTGEPAERVFQTTVGKMMGTDPHNVRKAKALMAWTDVLFAQAMGGDVCGEAARTYGERASGVADDAEMAFVNGLVRRTCPGFVLPKYVEHGARVAYKVRVDSDIPIAEVGLACGGQRLTSKLSGSDTVARFDAAVPGACTLTLMGNVEMATQVEVPTTGGDARCLVRGGRVNCG